MTMRRLLALLLALALLGTCALGEELGIELPDDPAEAADRLAVSDIELDGEIALEDFEIGLDFDLADNSLLDLGLSDELELGDGMEQGEDAQEIAPVKLDLEASADSNTLLAGYFDLLVGKKPEHDLRSNGYVGDQLTGEAKAVYDFLEKKIAQIAAGELSNTKIMIPKETLDFSSVDYEKGYDYIFEAARAVAFYDYTYHFFWLNSIKEAGIEDGLYYIAFEVSEEYRKGSDEFEIDTAKLASVKTAANNVRSLVKKYADSSDYQKLCGYRDYICQETDYNYDALYNGSEDNNPFTWIWVFDGNPDTKVVCDGYSKAFQYVCDLTAFDNHIKCYRVGGGGHSWNIVTMEDGRNYHVELTWIDQGWEYPFLAGAVPVDEKSYEIGSTTYVFDEDTYKYYSDLLPLADKAYDPDHVTPTAKPTAAPTAKPTAAPTAKPTAAPTAKPTAAPTAKPTAAPTAKPTAAPTAAPTAKPTAAPTAKPTATPTAKPASVKLNKTKASLKVGKKLTLKATVKPAGVKTTLTWSSSNKKVATVTQKGVVKAVKPGKATITVKTNNGKKASCKVTVLAVGTKIDKKHFPDAKFRKYVKANFDKNKDGALSKAEIKAVKEINVSFDGITSLKGVEVFTNLRFLKCSNNKLTSLAFSKNSNLEELDCSNNKLTTLDVSRNTRLKHLNCSDNKLKTLDVRKNTSLKELNCSYNRLTTLDVSKNTKLKELDCGNNKLAKLDVSKISRLEYLVCSNNQLKALNVKPLTKLKYLLCDGNRITSLPLGKKHDMGILDISRNKIKSIDIKYCYMLCILVNEVEPSWKSESTLEWYNGGIFCIDASTKVMDGSKVVYEP